MKKSKNHAPSCRLHKASGQAVVVINGQTRYLGKHGSKPSREAYARAIAEWSAQGKALVPNKGGITVNEVMAAYVEHAQSYYRKNGQPTSEMSWITDSLRPLRRLYGSTCAAEFGPSAPRRRGTVGWPIKSKTGGAGRQRDGRSFAVGVASVQSRRSIP